MRHLLTLLLCTLSFLGIAQQKAEKKAIAAGCESPHNFANINIANVNARINTGGTGFWDLIGRPIFEVPKGSGKNSLFAYGVWITGRDVNGQLKGAAERFRQVGSDFYSGPLNTDDASITAERCADFDQIFTIKKSDVELFKAWYQAGVEDRLKGTSNQNKQFPDYQIPASILEWPAHGRNYPPYNEDFYLAPFEDVNGDGMYNPLDGDFPAFHLSPDSTGNCQSTGAAQLYGDQVLWQVFNDKGNVHSETGGIPMGIEIRQQTFAYASPGDIRNVVFQGYELINRSSITLEDVHFAMFVDVDLGNAQDDYVGCDVSRGVGYGYNGDANDNDNGGAIGYGAEIPSVGFKFVMGPVQDADGIDNPISKNPIDWDQGNANPYPGVAVNYGDGTIDNERLGLTNFLYFNSDGSVRGDPRTLTEYFNFSRSTWRDGSPIVYGGTGYIGDASSQKDVPTHHMFPGNSDPHHWSTRGKDPGQPWTEITAGNTPFDRRFMASTGSFTLEPGAKNDLIVAYPWAQTDILGDVDRSIERMLNVADKTQAIFDNCFYPIEPPDAPELNIIEQDEQLVISIENLPISNNVNETYAAIDPTLLLTDSIYEKGQKRILTPTQKDSLSRYTFQGYKIYQVKDTGVTVEDLEDESKARLIFQTDIKDNITTLINYEFDEDLGQVVGIQKVEGANEGLKKVLKVEKDYFSEYPEDLVNHKSYYFLAVAYAANNGLLFDPTKPEGQGNPRPYLQSTSTATGQPIKPVVAIPHKPQSYPNTKVPNSVYGQAIPVTKHEGIGNSGFEIYLVEGQEQELLEPPYLITAPTYMGGKSPIRAKVIDPLNVPSGKYFVAFQDSTPLNGLDDARVKIYGEMLEDTVFLTQPIEWRWEMPIPELGLSLTLGNADYPGLPETEKAGFLKATITHTEEEWLTGVPDKEGYTAQNWILAGRSVSEVNPSTGVNESAYNDWDWYFSNGIDFNKKIDPNGFSEELLGGTWAPFRLAADHEDGPVPTYGWGKPSSSARSNLFSNLEIRVTRELNQLRFLHGVDIVITPDKSKWSRVPVIEMADTFAVGGVMRGRLRDGASLDKNGNPATTSQGTDDPTAPNYISGRGMSWFPGYAVDVETGERLNLAFGESSYLAGSNGRDMIWNPTDQITSSPIGEPILGGKHYIIVFRNNILEENFYTNSQSLAHNSSENRMPGYDEGRFILQQLNGGSPSNLSNVYRAGMWVGLPLLKKGAALKTMAEGLVPSEVTVSMRVQVPFQPYMTGTFLNKGSGIEPGVRYFVDKGPIEHNGKTYVRGENFVAQGNTFSTVDSDKRENVIATQNGGLPLYSFVLDEYATTVVEDTNALSALDRIKVVPNPYYPYASYGALADQFVKITYLPQGSEVSIYTVNGSLVRRLTQEQDTPNLNWDMKNQFGNEVEFGAYLVHVILPNGEEKILKWFKGESEFEIR